MTYQNKKKDIGAIWIKQSKAGNEFMSGKIVTPNGEEIKIVIFPNRYKKADNQPDYRIYISEPAENYQQAKEIENNNEQLQAETSTPITTGTSEPAVTESEPF